MRKSFIRAWLDIGFVLLLCIGVSIIIFPQKEEINNFFSFLGFIDYSAITLKVITVDTTLTSFALVFAGFVMSDNKSKSKFDSRELFFVKIPTGMFGIFKRTLFTRINILILTTVFEVAFILFNQDAAVIILFLFTVYQLWEILYTSIKTVFRYTNENYKILVHLVEDAISKYKKNNYNHNYYYDDTNLKDLIEDLKTSGYINNSNLSIQVDEFYENMLILAILSEKNYVWDFLFDVLKKVSNYGKRIELMSKFVITENILETKIFNKVMKEFNIIIEDLDVYEFNDYKNNIIEFIIDVDMYFESVGQRKLISFKKQVSYILTNFDKQLNTFEREMLTEL